MKIFFDTNVVLEFLAERPKASQVESVISLCEKNGWSKYLSVGSIYTIAYMTERILHQKGLVRPELIEVQRNIFQALLSSYKVVPLKLGRILVAAGDLFFSDLEDSFQYQSALQVDCDVLLTFNIKDFKEAKQEDIKIMEPEAFLSAL